jgi:hypothetical protein
MSRRSSAVAVCRIFPGHELRHPELVRQNGGEHKNERADKKQGTGAVQIQKRCRFTDQIPE